MAITFTLSKNICLTCTVITFSIKRDKRKKKNPDAEHKVAVCRLE